MKIDLHRIKIRVALAGFQDNAEHGVVAYNGELDVRPKYQREFVYSGKQRDEVFAQFAKTSRSMSCIGWCVATAVMRCLMGSNERLASDNILTVIFLVDDLFFHNLTAEEQEAIEYELMIYFAKGQIASD